MKCQKCGKEIEKYTDFLIPFTKKVVCKDCYAKWFDKNEEEQMKKMPFSKESIKKMITL